MKLTDICEDGKVVVALWMTEIAIRMIDEKEKNYHFCRETIDLCWEWLMNKNVGIWDIYDRISYNEGNLLDIVTDIYKKDPNLSYKYNVILMSVTYIDWQAFNYDEDESGYPEDLNEMSNEDFEEYINKLIEHQIIEKSTYENLLCYLKENYCEENKVAIKEKIIEMVQNKNR